MCQLHGFSQDLIILKNNTPISCIILEVTRDSVRYSRLDEKKDRIESLGKDKILMTLFGELSAGMKHTIFPDSVTHTKNEPLNPAFTENRNQGAYSGLYSLLFPGWGDYKVRQSRFPYWIVGAVSYGLIGAGIYYKTQSEKMYNQYKSKPEAAHTTYNTANDFHHRYLVMTSLGASLWLGDVILTVVKGARNTNSKKSQTTAFQWDHPEIFMESYGQVGLRWYF
jgi:hypothetical protein